MLVMMEHNVFFVKKIAGSRSEQIVIISLQDVLHADLMEHLSVEVTFNNQAS